MKKALLIILVIIGMIILWKIREPELKEHNRYQCAVLGYYEDCKTPLAPEDRLK